MPSLAVWSSSPTGMAWASIAVELARLLLAPSGNDVGQAIPPAELDPATDVMLSTF